MEIVLKYFSDFSETQLQQLQQLESLYKEWNEKINVISRKDIDRLYERHVLHSLSIAAVMDTMTDGLKKSMQVIDIGTGGGFPGIPLAIYYPEVQFHLVDSIAKKLKVVEAVAEGIGLKNVTTEHTRAEAIKKRSPALPGGGYDMAVSRAVAPLNDLWKWSKPLLKSQNTNYKLQTGLICLKGGDLAKEIQESGTRPRIVEINQLFPEPFFAEKYVLYVPR